MEFFEHQDDARRKTLWLLVLFVIAVLAMIGALYGAVHLIYLCFGGHAGLDWLVAIAGMICVIVGVGTALQSVALRDGGAGVARRLGGRAVDPSSPHRDERRLLNVTEEMALAAGLPVPALHVLDRESAINAFAAGFSLDDAAIGVTRGALDQLDRAELQGVIAHEVSHILSGDMRLNTRLMGALHGIEVMGEVGTVLARFGSGRGRRREVGALALVGIAVWLVGSVGYVAGQLIRAAVCRQREYLADAAAVQFTRNPVGLAGALRKTGDAGAGSRLRTPRAVEVSHLLFAEGLGGLLAQLGSTHPPLAERIARLDPSLAAGLAPGVGAAAAAGRPGRPLEGAMAFAGAPMPAHLQQARNLLDGLPAGLRDHCHTVEGAQAVTLCLLLGPEPVAQRERLAVLEEKAQPEVRALVRELAPQVAELDLRARLPVLELCLPALRRLSRERCDDLVTRVAELVPLDGRIDVFEWSLSLILRRHLYAQHRPSAPAARASLWGSARLLLSFVAHAGSSDDAEVGRAFELGSRAAGLRGAALLPRRDCTLAELDRAVEALTRAAPRRRESLVRGVAACIEADGKVGVREAEVFRAVVEAFGVAVPPSLD